MGTITVFTRSHAEAGISLVLKAAIGSAIHPSSSAYLEVGQKSEQERPDFSLPGQFFWEDSKAFPGQPSDMVTPAFPGSSNVLGALPPGGIQDQATSTGSPPGRSQRDNIIVFFGTDMECNPVGAGNALGHHLGPCCLERLCQGH